MGEASGFFVKDGKIYFLEEEGKKMVIKFGDKDGPFPKSPRCVEHAEVDEDFIL